MALNRVDLGIQYFPQFAADRAIANAQIYIGLPNLDPQVVANQIQAYVVQENGTQVPVPQPIRTGAGGVPTYNGSPVQIGVAEARYSVKILSSTGSQIYYQPDNTDLTIVNAAQVTYDPPVVGASPTTVDVPLNSQINASELGKSGGNTIANLVGVVPNTSAPVYYNAVSYYNGFAATTFGAEGGGLFVWDATQPKATHNGGTRISPTVPWDGLRATVGDFVQGVGETDPSGNGCWMRVDLSDVQPEWFGSLGDGQDDSDTLMAMADWGREVGELVLNLKDGKQYVYTNPLFLTGIKNRLVINGYGASFTNKRASLLGPSPANVNNEGLVFYPIFYGGGRTLLFGPGYYYGELIDTVAAGSTSFTVSTGGDMSDFEIGKRVLIFGYGTQVGGFPSTARYFEYQTITNIVGNTITVSMPLRYTYYSDWPVVNPGADFPGPPRVIPMSYDDAQEIAHLEINGLTLAPDPGWLVGSGGTIDRNGRLNVGGYRRCILNDVVGKGGLYIFQGEEFEDNGSTFDGAVEIDKYINTCIINAVDYSRLSQGTGTRLVHIKNGSVIRNFTSVSALETAIVEDSQVLAGGAGAGIITDTQGTNLSVFQRNTINTVSGNRAVRSATMRNATFTKISGTRIDMSSADFISTNMHRTLQLGSVLFNSNAEPVFRLTDTPRESAGRVFMDGVFLGASFVSPATLYLPLFQKVVSLQNTFTGPKANDIVAAVPSGTAGNSTIREDQRTNGISYVVSSTVNPQITTTTTTESFSGGPAYVAEMQINVLKAYTGATATALLRIREIGGTNFALIDLRTTGLRSLTVAGNFGSVGADVLTGLFAGRILSFQYFTTAAVAYVDGQEAAVWEIVMRLVPTKSEN